MDRRVTHLTYLGSPPPCKQALSWCDWTFIITSSIYAKPTGFICEALRSKFKFWLYELVIRKIYLFPCLLNW